MEIGEAVKVANVNQETTKCNPANTDTSNWKVVIDKIKGGKGSASDLKDALIAAGVPAPAYPPR